MSVLIVKMNKNVQSLSNNNLTLNLLNENDLDELTLLAAEEKIWQYAPLPYFQPDVFKKEWFDKALKQMQEGKRIAFVILLDNKLIGATSYYDIDVENNKLKIGYTWFHPSQWGTTVNARSKLILLAHAFENMLVNKVGFSIDLINKPSYMALMKLGIQQEGILRNDIVLPDKRIRDSVILGVIREEWPHVKEIIHERLSRKKDMTASRR
jgi:RimJ/RimL family protein N-acetyltransferase